MDANTLAKYIGKEHVEEVQTLMENDSQLQNKVSFKNPVVALVLTVLSDRNRISAISLLLLPL